MPALKNPKHELFCLEFLKDLNGTQAAIRSGYSDRTAASIAYELLRKPDISARVKELQADRFKRLHMDADELLMRLATLARVDIRKAFDEGGALRNVAQLDDDAAYCVAGVEVEELYGASGDDRVQIGFTKKVKMRDPTPALRLLAEHLKIIKGDDGVDRLANALADRMEAARKRVKNRTVK